MYIYIYIYIYTYGSRKIIRYDGTIEKSFIGISLNHIYKAKQNGILFIFTDPKNTNNNTIDKMCDISYLNELFILDVNSEFINFSKSSRFFIIIFLKNLYF